MAEGVKLTTAVLLPGLPVLVTRTLVGAAQVWAWAIGSSPSKANSSERKKVPMFFIRWKRPKDGKRRAG